ncbi:hypothetical protein OS493_037910, partial [Desmophyllum pertusum]
FNERSSLLLPSFPGQTNNTRSKFKLDLFGFYGGFPASVGTKKSKMQNSFRIAANKGSWISPLALQRWREEACGKQAS